MNTIPNEETYHNLSVAKQQFSDHHSAEFVLQSLSHFHYYIHSSYALLSSKVMSFIPVKAIEYTSSLGMHFIITYFCESCQSNMYLNFEKSYFFRLRAVDFLATESSYLLQLTILYKHSIFYREFVT